MSDKNVPDQPTIFYSWQSNDINTKKFITKNLAKVLNEIETSTTTDLSPRKDQDTQGVAGAVSITETILQKIDRCSIFLADVSIVGTLKNKKQVNQNVMFELGYAAKTLRFENIIMVANIDNGSIDKLPFDIRNRRVIGFSITNDAGGKSFQQTLKYAIQLHLEQIVKELSGDELSKQKGMLLSALEQKRPTKRIAEKYGRIAFRQLASMAPAPYKNGDNADEYARMTLDLYAETFPDVLDIAEVVNSIVEYHDGAALIGVLSELYELTRFFDPQPDSGALYEISKDYYSLLAYEVVALVLGSIIENRCWDVLPDVFKVRFLRANEYDKPRDIADTYHYPTTTVNFDLKIRNMQDRQGVRPMISERYKDEGWLQRQYINGSILRWMTTSDYPWAINFVVGYDRSYKYQPDFLAELKHKTFFDILSNVSKAKDKDEYKKWLWSQMQQSFTGWSGESLTPILSEYNINAEADLGTE